jgi:hypothetical protein
MTVFYNNGNIELTDTFPLQDLSSTTRATFTMDVTQSIEVATHDCLTCIIQELPSPIDWEFILLVYYS